METTLENMKKVFNNPEVAEFVKLMIIQKSKAEQIRKQVNDVHREVLSRIELYNDLNRKHFPDEPIKRITEGKDIYLSMDDNNLEKFYNEADKILREHKIKPENMERDYCPALVAENDLVTIEHKLIKLTGESFGVTVSSLLSGGMETYRKWIELVTMAIISKESIKG